MRPPDGGLLLLTLAFGILSHFSWIYAQPLRVDATLTARDSVSDSGLLSASWIWVATPAGSSAPPAGNAAFIKNFISPSGMTATHAAITITAVNNFTLWVNGAPIGATTRDVDDWKSAQNFSVFLDGSKNVFSVLASNDANAGSPSGGLLAAIRIFFADGSTQTVVSDATWAATAAIPDDFPMPATTTQFVSASVAAPFGSGAWGTSVTLADTDGYALNLSTNSVGSWIWSTKGAAVSAAVSTIGCRKTVQTIAGKTAQAATILLTVDNTFSLYVNGRYVGAPPTTDEAAWERAQLYTVPLSPASNTFTVIARNFAGDNNGPSSAGLIAVLKMFFTDGSSAITGTDATWLCGDAPSAPSFIAIPDSSLTAAFVQGPVPLQPWGEITQIYNALDAASIPAPPFTRTVTSKDKDDTSPKSKTSIGPIIGGVVGGVAIIIAAILAFLFWRRRKGTDAEGSENELKLHSNTRGPSPLPADYFAVQPYTQTQPQSIVPSLYQYPGGTPSDHYPQSGGSVSHQHSGSQSYPPGSVPAHSASGAGSSGSTPSEHTTSQPARGLPAPPLSKLEAENMRRRNDNGGRDVTAERHQTEMPPPSYEQASEPSIGQTS
ncbi:hypothetical protein C8J57DRAFT_1271490 [Mycena rebaudengoi]|nr:hypothetical protein C8J57DRAFT_1271490 [Mycena rebaudengoi]